MPTATCTRRNGSTRRCPTTFARNLTALRELALLWLADQVDAALEKYRADKNITDTWEAGNASWSRSPAAESETLPGIPDRVEVERN